jgi:lysosomal alpha-mannosidase
MCDIINIFCYRDGVGKEVISHFSTGWATNGYFYTDSNGREILERKRNYRPTWKVNISEPVAGNYYPVTSVIAIKSKDITFGVLPDRAQGGSSLKDGDIELMVHRRLLHDDAFGVGEALNETAFGKGMVARGRHMVVLGTSSNSPTAMAEQRRIALSRLVMSPWLLLAPTKMTFDQWQKNYFTEVS